MDKDENEQLRRNELGDIDIGSIKFDWSDYRRSRYIYVFKYYDPEVSHYRPYFQLYSRSLERLENAKQMDGYFERTLFKSPEQPPYDAHIRITNLQLSLLVTFFKEVFEERAFVEGHQPNHKYWSVILPVKLNDQIQAYINEFNLQPIQDLIFELIAIGQDKYVETVAHWERPEYQKLINTAEKEAKKVSRVIEKMNDEDWSEESKTKPSTLMQVKFVFNDETINIQHGWLAMEIVDALKKEFNELPLKSWKKELAKYKHRFDDNKHKSHYKHKLAKSYYNMLTKGGFLPVLSKNKTPNNVMLCVARFLEFCLIPVGSTDELNEVKIKLVRNWIKRKDFQPHMTSLEVIADDRLLKKYFEPTLIDLISNVKKLDALAIVGYISDRFDLQDKLPELAHIISALREVNWLIGHQLSKDSGWAPTFPEFDNFSTLINGIQNNRKIISLKFQMDDDDQERDLVSRLPLYLLEEALKDYTEDHRVEFDNDVVRAFYEGNQNEGVSVKLDDKFNVPEERFIIRFVKACYDFLLHEIPPVKELDYMPSERYYAIIAVMLQQTWFFYHQRHPEEFVITKVKQWHKFALQGTKAS